MKKRLVKHCFNMVEIALALAVLAIGMSSILVLFPVGINANKSAIADNNLADIGEYLMGFLRAGCAAEWAKIAENPEVENPDFIFSKSIVKGYDELPDDGTESIDPLSSKYDDDVNNSSRITSNLYRIKNNNNSVFLYKQMTGDIVDFAAVIRVWQEKTDFFAVNASSYSVNPPLDGVASDGEYTLAGSSFIKVTIEPGGSIERYARVLCIEISWPAQAPYEQREKRLFQQEIFNEAFRWQ